MKTRHLIVLLPLLTLAPACDDGKNDDKSAEKKKDKGPPAFDGPLTPELVASVSEFNTEIMNLAMDYKKAVQLVESRIGKAHMASPTVAWWAVMDADGTTCHGYSLEGDDLNQIKLGRGPSEMSGATLGYDACVKAAGGSAPAE